MSGDVESSAPTGSWVIIDESAMMEPDDRFTYVVASAVVLSTSLDVAHAAAIEAVGFGTLRNRPFHWVDEGGDSRRAMLAAAEANAHVLVASVASKVGRRGQEHARQAGLRLMLEFLADEVEIGGLMIESRERSLSPTGQNKYDFSTLIDARHGRLLLPGVPFRWVEKTEPLVWLADALAGAVATSNVTGLPLDPIIERAVLLEVGP